MLFLTPMDAYSVLKLNKENSIFIMLLSQGKCKHDDGDDEDKEKKKKYVIETEDKMH